MRVAALVALAAFAACSSDPQPDLVYLTPNGPTTVVIEGPGYPPAPLSTGVGSIGFWSMSTWGTSTAPQSEVIAAVALSWVPEMCREIDLNVAHPGTGLVWVRIRTTRDDDVPELPPGTYTIPTSTYQPRLLEATAELISYGPLCYVMADTAARQGTVTIISANAQRVTGSLDLVFFDGTTASGTFEAPVCNAKRSADLSCQP